MKRRKSNQKSQGKRQAAAGAAQKKKSMSRRDLLGLAKFGAVAAVVFGGGGWYVVSKVQASMSEGDLSKIGNGIPAIVQVHDPQCPTCNALQRAARDALASFDDAKVQYLVANLTVPDGRDFAREHNAGRVTLLLFDGEGRRVRSLTGRRTKHELEALFRDHLDRYGAKDAASG